MVVAYLFTTFPKRTETFLQREIIAMQALGVELRLYSLWGGGGTFNGLPVAAFNKWQLLRLFGIIPWVMLTRWEVMAEIFHGLATRRPPSWINFWENMLGAGFAGCFYAAFRRDPPDLIHAAWSGAPATAAYFIGRMNGTPYSTAAHAYDLYEHGGDWWLYEKLAAAKFIHTSTEMGRATIIEHGLPPEKIHCIRRGLDLMPPLKPLRLGRTPLRIVCVARLVEKKGLDHQLRIYAALRDAGLAYEAHILGDGRLRAALEDQAAQLNLKEYVTFLGHVPLSKVWIQLQWADVLVHTGVIAPSGDRDGLPNVIPEAMAAGTLVVTSPTAATTEAVSHGQSGLVAGVTDTAGWVAALHSLATDDELAERLRAVAHAWAEENFDAHKNAARLHALFTQAVDA